MKQLEPNPVRRKGLWHTLAVAAMAGASAATLAVPATVANADPPPSPPAPAPADPNAAPNPVPAPDTAPGPADPNAPAPADPNAPPPIAANPPDAGRVNNAVGGFSFVIPPGWVESDATNLDYGSALLSKETGPAAFGQPPPVANDTRIVLGRLDQKLYASAEPDDSKAAARLGSDMGEFFMPYPGTRINQETTPLNAGGMAGSASYYEVKFNDNAKPIGQIWTGVVGPPPDTAAADAAGQRWFVVWLGTANDPVDRVAAKVLAESMRPWTPPPAPPPPPGANPAAPPPAPAPPAPAGDTPVPAAPALQPIVPA